MGYSENNIAESINMTDNQTANNDNVIEDNDITVEDGTTEDIDNPENNDTTEDDNAGEKDDATEDDSIEDDIIGATDPKPCVMNKNPKVGSCIGVLYRSNVNESKDFCIKDPRNKGKFLCVHNGRLVKKTSQYILVNHFAPTETGAKEETRIFYRSSKCPALLDFKVTPNLGCPGERKSKPGNIRHGTCAGIVVRSNKAYDVKNGRYDYYIKTGNPPTEHCYLPEASIPDAIQRVYYYHYPVSSIDTKSNPPKLIPNCTPTYRPQGGETIKNVRRHSKKIHTPYGNKCK